MGMWKLVVLPRISTISNSFQAACRFVFFLPRALAAPRRAEKYVFPMVFQGFWETVSFRVRCVFCQRICLFSQGFQMILWGVCFLTFAVEVPGTYVIWYTQSLHKVYIKSTQSLHKVYTNAYMKPTQSLHKVYIKSTQSLHEVYIKVTRSIHTACVKST